MKSNALYLAMDHNEETVDVRANEEGGPRKSGAHKKTVTITKRL